MMTSDHEPDDLCPSCGVPQPFGRRGASCSRCAYQFAAEGEPACPMGHLTPFGYGVCGLIAGGYLGAGVALMDPDTRLEDPHLVLSALLLGIACCRAAWWLGKRLDRRVRRGFEAGLFGFVAAAFAVFVLGLCGVASADTLLAVAATVMAVATPILGRVLYPRRG